MLTRAQILTLAQYFSGELQSLIWLAAVIDWWLKSRQANKRLLNSDSRAQIHLFRREPNCLNHFVARLDVIKLRLKQPGLGAKFLSDSGIRLRWQSLTLFELLCGDPARFRAQRKNLLGYVHHFSSARQFVSGSVNSELDFVRYSSQVLARLSETSIAFTDRGLSSATIEQFIGQTRAKGSKVAGEERDLVRIIVSGKSRHVGKVIRLCQANACRGFLHLGPCRDDFRMRCQRRTYAFLAMARLLDFGDRGIEFDFRRYRESQHVVQLHGQVRE